MPNRDQADFDLGGVGDKRDSCPTKDVSGLDADTDGSIDTEEGLLEILTDLPSKLISERSSSQPEF